MKTLQYHCDTQQIFEKDTTKTPVKCPECKSAPLAFIFGSAIKCKCQFITWIPTQQGLYVIFDWSKSVVDKIV